MKHVTRNFVSFVLAIGLYALLQIITILSVLNHYQCTEAAIHYFGMEGMPLAKNTLLGGFFATFLPDVTAVQTTAAIISICLALGLTFIVKYSFEIVEWTRELNYYKRAGDEENASEARWRLGRTALRCALLAALMVFPVMVDIDLAKLRTVSVANGFVSATDAVDLPIFSQLYKDNPLSWLLVRAELFAWGYLCLLGIIIFLTEDAKTRVTDTYHRLCASAEEYAKSFKDDYADQEEETADNTDPAPQMEATEPSQPVGGTSPADSAGLFPPPESAAPGSGTAAPGDNPTAATCHNAILVPVIGLPGKQVTIPEALADRVNYVVDDENRVWSREYYNLLHEE